MSPVCIAPCVHGSVALDEIQERTLCRSETADVLSAAPPQPSEKGDITLLTLLNLLDDHEVSG
ncbi:MAG: hypothetical protein HY731_11165 [Candidatus Tectomicrobia bacterium]|nr:hypothetical protein [Candidatus Tectomicrobia bacterium]